MKANEIRETLERWLKDPSKVLHYGYNSRDIAQFRTDIIAALHFYSSINVKGDKDEAHQPKKFTGKFR